MSPILANMNPDLNQIETDILVGLSDFIPRNQNQITDLIHKDREKSTDRVHVHRALKNLKPYFERRPNQLDELGKRWVLKKDIDTIRQIVKEYPSPSIVLGLQKSDKIINLISSHINEETYSDFLYGSEEHTKISDFIPDMFRYSVTFLKMFLTNDSYMSSFYRIFYLLHCREEFFKVYSEEDFMQDSKFNNFDCFEVLDIDTDRIFFEAFNHSVINDFINGYSNPEALKLIETLRENEFNRSDYETTQIEIETEDSTKIIRGS